MNRENTAGAELARGRRRTDDPITGGLFLIGLGILLFTGWWWPGIMVALGIAVGAGLAFRGQFASAIIAAAIFFSIPFVVDNASKIPLQTYGPMVLIGLGAIGLIRAFSGRS